MHSDELQLAVLKQHNACLLKEVLPFTIKNYQHQDELNMLLYTAKQLKYHYFAVGHQPHLNLQEKASQVSRTAFLSYLVEIYGTQHTQGSVLLICDPLTKKYISLNIWSEIQPSNREGIFRIYSFEFLN